MHRFSLLAGCFFLLSCNTPEARLKRLQHDFWEKFAKQDYFEITLRNEVYRLPLPLSSPPSKANLEELQQAAQSIDIQQLDPADKQKLTLLRAALEDMQAQAFDPSRYVPEISLGAYATADDLNAYLEHFPAYYAKVESRWQQPDIRLVPRALERAQALLDQLTKMEKEDRAISGSAIDGARGAVKDFIGLCQSAWLR